MGRPPSSSTRREQTYSLAATGAASGDLVLIVADADGSRRPEALGHVRLEMGDRLGLRQPGVLSYVWVHRFPMFKWDAEGERWDATHNPFSAPVPDDVSRFCDSDPGCRPRAAVRPRAERLGVGGGSGPDPPARPCSSRHSR